MPQVSPLEFIERRVCSMTVGGCSILMGAYAERMYGRMAQEKTGVQPDENRLREMTARIAEAAKEFRADRENRDSVSISKEGRDWLCSDSVYENMKDVDAVLYFLQICIQTMSVSRKNFSRPIRMIRFGEIREISGWFSARSCMKAVFMKICQIKKCRQWKTYLTGLPGVWMD